VQVSIDRVRTRVLPVMLLLAMCACAQVPKQMSYLVPDGEPRDALNWPDPPEVPRYRYAGQLLGERNFINADASQPGFFTRALHWIVGLDNADDADRRSLLRPQCGMVDTSRIYVTDDGRAAVFVFDTAKADLRIWTRADRGSAFVSPIGIAAGPDNTVLVADSGLGRIVRLGANGEPLGGFGGEVLTRPTGLARDAAHGRVYVADTGADNIKVFDDKGGLLSVIGQPGDGAGEFNAPTHISIRNDRLYISDTLNARVQVLTLDGRVLAQLGKRGLYVGNLTRPKGVATDVDGNVYVVESYYDHLLVFDADGRYLMPIGGTGSGIGRFYLPAGAWSDSAGRIYVADMYNRRVMIFQYLGAST
jgi:DNA-binding beta-propeller fold protein YncE